MTDLSDFLGGLVSGISHARLNSDIESVKIAEIYAQDPLLQNLSVPRMRIDTVELSIPVAMEGIKEKKEVIYEISDTSKLLEISYAVLLKSLSTGSLPAQLSNELKKFLEESTRVMVDRTRTNPAEEPLLNYTTTVALFVTRLSDTIFKQLKRKPLSADEQFNLQKDIVEKLRSALKEQVSISYREKKADSLNVIVEAARLREIKPENIIMIKMKVSEQGLEWIKMENSKGEVISKLTPE